MQKQTAKIPPVNLYKWIKGFLCTLILIYSSILPSYAKEKGDSLKNVTVTLTVAKEKLENVFKLIEGQTDFKFVYNTEFIGKQSVVSLTVNKENLDKVLEQLLAPISCSFQQYNRNILITSPNKIIPEAVDKSHSDTTYNLKGVILSAATNEPVPNATVFLKGINKPVISTSNGEFSVPYQAAKDSVVISHISYETKTFEIRSLILNRQIYLQEAASQIKDVVVNTGYQNIPKERVTKSFDFIDNNLLNRSITTNVIDRIENLTPGVLFNKGLSSATATASDPILIRGRSTIYANASPLIVVDNYPYDGDIGNINPNDVESITILKDAAAASIWGVRAGNGVIVITTKKGRAGKPSLQFTSSVTVQGKPDLFNMPTISSADYIGLENILYAQGYYDYALNSFSHQPVTPVVELLAAESNGSISPLETDTRINALKSNDVRNDLEKYFYRSSINQQYSINTSGASENVKYYLSAGYDHNIASLVGQDYNRITIHSANTFNVSPQLQVQTNINYTQTITQNNGNQGYATSPNGNGLYPYAQLAGVNGQPLTIAKYYSDSYTDTAGAGKLLDWKYRPLSDMDDEINKVTNKDLLADVAIKYTFSKNLFAEARYQFEDVVMLQNDFYNQTSFFARDLINRYTQVNPDGSLSYPIPMGGIMNVTNSNTISHQGRIQLNFNKDWRDNRLSAIAGWEIKNLLNTGNSYRLYGYQPDQSTVTSNIDFASTFRQYSSPYLSLPISNPQSVSQTLNRFLSEYLNGSYTYKNKYSLSASAREDASNLFGVKTNQKGVPLWSMGGAWEMSKEPFYQVQWLPLLKLRVTYGFQGNISQLASAYTTAIYGTSFNTGAVTATIQNPPNERLQWEKTGILNFGVDFGTKNKSFLGTVEYYMKNGKDIFGYAPIDATVGVADNGGTSSFFGNIAGIKGHGLDLQLESHILKGRLKWVNNFILSYSLINVATYAMPVSALGYSYVNESFINPAPGKPLFAIFSYKWGGLDTAGNPQGYIGKAKSTDYASLVNETQLKDMQYSGPSTPPVFGSFRNTFQWEAFSFSFNISYKLGYYFRKPSVNYSNLFNSWTGNNDYAKRWQKPGDEKNTYVPSLVYPADYNRDQFYTYSSVLVEKADNIRLEDVTFSYDIRQAGTHRLPFKNARLYVYVSNIGPLWLADKDKTDPYFLGVPRQKAAVAIGININL